MRKTITGIIFVILTLAACNKTQPITTPELDYKTEIIGTWALKGGPFEFTFLENEIVEMNELSPDGTILDRETSQYQFTAESIHIYCSELSESNCRDDLTIYYIPLDNFSTLSLPRIVAHYSDGREDIDLSLENIKLNRKD